jgi:prepilin-type N-terminal cleavage/methylation domain-containing protein
MRRPGPRPHRGFTLVESMAAVAVLSVLASIASYLILDNVGQCMDAATAAQLHSELAVAMDRATRELRKIDLDAGAGGVAPDIETVLPTYIEWEDQDGDQYWLLLSGGELRLKIDGGVSARLMSDVTALTVSTYDEDNTQLGWILGGATCDPIRRVQVEVTAVRNGVTESLRTKVFIRSTMEGDD